MTRRAVACDIVSVSDVYGLDFFQPLISSAKQHMYVSTALMASLQQLFISSIWLIFLGVHIWMESEDCCARAMRANRTLRSVKLGSTLPWRMVGSAGGGGVAVHHLGSMMAGDKEGKARNRSLAGYRECNHRGAKMVDRKKQGVRRSRGSRRRRKSRQRTKSSWRSIFGNGGVSWTGRETVSARRTKLSQKPTIRSDC